MQAVALPRELVGRPSMDGGGGVPAAHVEANGVAVGVHACFYSVSPNAVYCYDTVNAKWNSMKCSVSHKGGSILGNGGGTIMVAGGFDAGTSKPTAVIDIFTVTASVA